MVSRSATTTGTHTPPAGAPSEQVLFSGDVSLWDSYEFRVYRTTPGGSSDREMDFFLLRWYDQDPANPGTQVPSADMGFKPMTDIQMAALGPHEGQWLQVVRLPHASGNSQVTWALTSMTQGVPRHHARQVTGQVLDVIWNNVAAGQPGSSEEYAALVTGNVDLVLAAPTVGAKGEFRINIGGDAFIDTTVDAAIDNTKIMKLNLPRSVLSIRPTNKGTVAGSYSARMITSEA